MSDGQGRREVDVDEVDLTVEINYDTSDLLEVFLYETIEFIEETITEEQRREAIKLAKIKPSDAGMAKEKTEDEKKKADELAAKKKMDDEKKKAEDDKKKVSNKFRNFQLLFVSKILR